MTKRKDVMKTSFDLKKIAAHIRTFRIEAHMTQEELSDLIGVSPQMISNYENAISCPSIETLTRIHDYFGADLNYLLANDPSFKANATALKLTETEIEMILAYRRRQDYKQKVIRTLCFEGAAYRNQEEEIKAAEDNVAFLKNHKNNS